MFAGGRLMQMRNRNLWPSHPDKFVIPPDAGDGYASEEANEFYRRHCYPTEAEILSTIARARAEFMDANPGKTLDVLYVLTNADEDWMNGFRERIGGEGWGVVHGSTELELDEEGTDVAMAVDMEIARKAEVFVGNGVSDD
jgi:hypothetical protein